MIFIPGNVPSSKSSKIKTKNGIFNSKTVQKYLKLHGIKGYSSRKKEIQTWRKRPCIFPFPELWREFQGHEPPFFVGFHFVRDSRRKADFHNLVQLPADLLTAGKIIEDDNMDNFFSVPMWRDGKWYSVDKNEPGFYLEVFNRVILERI